MGSIVGDAPSLISTPKYKRRKVSAVRDFPPGCGPNATLVCVQTQTKEVEGEKEVINVDDVVSKVLQDIENDGEKGEDICEVERIEPQEPMIQPGVENGVELKASDSVTSGKAKSTNEASKNVLAENADASVEIQNVEENLVSGDSECVKNGVDTSLEIQNVEENLISGDSECVKNGVDTSLEIQNVEETHVLSDEKHDQSNDLKEVRSEFATRLTDSGIVNIKELTDAPNNKGEDKESSVEQHLLPHYPIPPDIVWKERKYPPPRRVSAVRHFPAGCGRRLKSSGRNQVVEYKPDVKLQETGVLNQNEGKLEENENSEDKIHEKLSESNEGVAVVKMVDQTPILGQPSEIKGQEKDLEDSNDEHQDLEQSGYDGKDEMDFASLPDRLKNAVVVYVKNKDKKKTPVSVSTNDVTLQEESSPDINIEKQVIVQGVMCEASCPWKQEKAPAKPSSSRARARKSVGNKQSHAKCKDSSKKVEETPKTIVPYIEGNEVGDISRPLAINYDDSSEDEQPHDFQFLPRSRDNNCEVTPPPFMASSSGEKGSRSKVRETLRLFQVLVRKILQGEETKSKEKGKTAKRVDLIASQMLKAKGKYINTEKKIGDVPGVEIGDIFSYRSELAIIGLHTPLQSGIDTIKVGKHAYAISVVASGGYDNDVDNSDVLIYTGQGGNPTGTDKQHEDQKLERANLALKNCIENESPVRVIRGFKESKSSEKKDGKSKMVATYTYDGLYTVVKYWAEVASHGKLVYKFELRRNPGQLQLAWKEMKQSKKSKVREGRCVDDISRGKEKYPICAMNTIDDEKPPSFTYITSVMYPDWCQPIPPKGCSCKDGCLDSEHCSCAGKNGGEIPYNLSGAIVEAKSLVYECGPSCNCPPSCFNRVSQHGIKLPLEIFKTESRGWGVRTISAVPSGSFICEYIGELLDDKEAEQRAGSDEYLFDIGQNYNDSGLSDDISALMPDTPSVAGDVVENIGFTIDAAKYGNIGRFINHSCSPNLYAQNVLYDYEDKRIPHIMMFAAENIPPLQELTYHYNYSIDQVFDSEGNIKRKDCYCGAAECSGRMY